MGKRRNPARRKQPTPRGSPGPTATPTKTATPGSDETVRIPPIDTARASRRLAARSCGWCRGPIAVKTTGRLPKWCSPSCRQRAWEQSRAAASGLSAVRVVERRVEIPTPVVPRRRDWPRLLGELARQLGDGRIYDRDLLALAVALNVVHESLGCRSGAGWGQPTEAPRPLSPGVTSLATGGDRG
jgi:hypothetical protein